MDNIEKLFNPNKKLNLKYYLKNSELVFRYYDDNISYLDSIFINKLIKFVNDVYIFVKNNPINIRLNIKPVNFKDRLVSVFFECICYYIISTTKCKISHNLRFDNTHLSNLNYLNSKGFNKDIFIRNFYEKIYEGFYRKIIRLSDCNSNYLSVLMTNIDSFLKYLLNEKQDSNYRNDISMVVAELVGNALEHTKSDCLINIDLVQEDKKRIINIAIINFSDIIMGEFVKEKMYKDEQMLDDRFLQLKQAFDTHNKICKERESYDYNIEDFYMLACFQKKISGRMYRIGSGTGLTELVKTLNKIQSNSENDACYMMSGNKGLFFNKHLTKINKDGWIGFNEAGDFLNDIPQKGIVLKSRTFLKGVAYNLIFSV
ncbi:MAG: hypothetical protein ACLUCH_05405 [Lachnospirales bacterium]